MKALLICPADRGAVRFLAHTNPLANLSAFGKSLTAHWLEHLSDLGVTEARILASDRPELVQKAVGDGSRWGMKVEVVSESRELAPAEARAKYVGTETGGWLEGTNDVTLMDHFPELPEHPVFNSYAHWFNALRALLSHKAPASEVGVKEVKPGVWVSALARISPSAELRAPCWVGANTVVGPDAVIGPMAVLEERVMVEAAVEIINSAVAPETFVGELTEVKNSLANGSLLINWRTTSCIRVPDAFLMCSLAKREHRIKTGHWIGRVLAIPAMILSFPLAMWPMLVARLSGRTALRPLVAVRPQLSKNPGPMETVVYHELANCKGWLRFWPQLWSVAKGDFVWVGNRPLSPAEVSELSTDFERLWLAAPTGLVSLAHAEGVVEAFGEQTRTCASFYAMQANWRLDLSILTRIFLPPAMRSSIALL